MKLPYERFSYSAMPQRAAFTLPDNARVAVYVIVNLEEWDIEKPLAREYVPAPAGVKTVPNIPNWAWHEYGMRVGVWRLIEALEKRKLRANVSINARVCEGEGEPVARAVKALDWPFMGHGYAQATMHVVEDQGAVIQRAFDVLQRYSGKAPKGWLGPGLHETLDTLDYLAETGFKYVCDWPLDEHPFDMQTRGGTITAMPYSFELSDLPMMAVHAYDSDIWLKRSIDQFDRLYAEGATQPRVLSMGVHPYIMGVPHRIKYFEQAIDYMMKKPDVWFTTADGIYDWYKAEQAL